MKLKAIIKDILDDIGSICDDVNLFTKNLYRAKP